MIFQDVERYKGNHQSVMGIFVSHPGFRFMVIHRLCNRYRVIHPVGAIARWWHKRLSVKFGFQIPHTTSIDAGLFLGHFGGIVINPNSKIGGNCNIAQGVTIGRVNRGEKEGCPSIGDRVWIGANAVLVGKITIGNDVLIAPLSYVNSDIPSNSVVMGNPANVVGDKGSRGYINNMVNQKIQKTE